MPLRGLRLSEDLKIRLQQVQKARGYKSVNAFMLESIEEKLQRMNAVESVSESEARIAADFSRIVREVRSVHNTQQAQYALLDALTKYVSTCMVEPPQDLLVSARVRGKLRYEKLLREAARTITGESENPLLEKRNLCRLTTQNDRSGCGPVVPHLALPATGNVYGRAAWEPFCESSGCTAIARG